MSEVDIWENLMEQVMAEVVDVDFQVVTVHLLPDTELRTAIASSATQRMSGMIGKDFTEWDAMLFTRPRSMARWGFHNVGVEHDLLVAFFDKGGNLVSQEQMPAGHAGPTWAPDSAVFALELPDLGPLDPTTMLKTVDDNSRCLECGFLTDTPNHELGCQK